MASWQNRFSEKGCICKFQHFIAFVKAINDTICVGDVDRAFDFLVVSESVHRGHLPRLAKFENVLTGRIIIQNEGFSLGIIRLVVPLSIGIGCIIIL